MSLRTFVIGALVSLGGLANIAMAQATTATGELPAASPVLGTDTVHGCYSSIGSMSMNISYDTFNSQGQCARNCRGIGKAVGATYSYSCWCGDEYPALNTLVSDSECTEPCPGYNIQNCGGLNAYTIYNTGLRVSVASEANVTSSSASSSVGTSPQTTATNAAVVTDTVTPTASASSSSKATGSTNTVGIAVGVVVGVVAITAIGAGVWFYMRKKRNQEIEDEHRRNAAVNAFMGKPPSSSGGVSISDSRLDPVMAQRRMSDGSIADNQDYSRRILRVTNA